MLLPKMPVVEFWPRNDAADGFANLVAVEAEVGVFARGQKGHQGHAGDAGSLLSAPPVACVGLGFGEILQTAVVHLANVTRNDLADVLCHDLST